MPQSKENYVTTEIMANEEIVEFGHFHTSIFEFTIGMRYIYKYTYVYIF